MDELSGHWSDPAHLEHQPLDDGVALAHVGRPELSGLLRQVHQDRAGLEHREGLAARAVLIDDCRHAAIGIHRPELRLVLIAGDHVHVVKLPRQRDFLQHQHDLERVRAGHAVEFDRRRCLLKPKFSLWGSASA